MEKKETEKKTWLSTKAELIVMEFVLMAVIAISGLGFWKVGAILSRLTQTTSQLAQKANVDFPTQTNSVFGVFQTVNPK